MKPVFTRKFSFFEKIILTLRFIFIIPVLPFILCLYIGESRVFERIGKFIDKLLYETDNLATAYLNVVRIILPLKNNKRKKGLNMNEDNKLNEVIEEIRTKIDECDAAFYNLEIYATYGGDQCYFNGFNTDALGEYVGETITDLTYLFKNELNDACYIEDYDIRCMDVEDYNSTVNSNSSELEDEEANKDTKYIIVKLLIWSHE